MDDERLKNPPGPGLPDYFDELLERIRDIRASERRMYLRVKEIFALASDYSTTESHAQLFFKTIQNKLHFAATAKTAPQLITECQISADFGAMGRFRCHGIFRCHALQIVVRSHHHAITDPDGSVLHSKSKRFKNCDVRRRLSTITNPR